MRISLWAMLLLALTTAWAQDAPAPPRTSSVHREGRGPGFSKEKMVFRQDMGGMGKWWKNSETAKQLQLTDGQIAQLDQKFVEHRLKLIDYGADMEKQDLKLQTLLDADSPNEAQVGIQVDQVLTARGKLEREYTMMNLDLRKVLSLEQWKQLKSMRGERGGFGDKIYFHREFGPPGGRPMGTPLPPPELGPGGPAPDDLF